MPLALTTDMTLSRAHKALTLLAAILAWMAVDDITTDTSTGNFMPERIALIGCGVWFLYVAWRVTRAA
jgi:hypothetical protein